MVPFSLVEFLRRFYRFSSAEYLHRFYRFSSAEYLRPVLIGCVSASILPVFIASPARAAGAILVPEAPRREARQAADGSVPHGLSFSSESIRVDDTFKLLQLKIAAIQ